MSGLRVLHVARSGWPAIGGLENAVGALAEGLVERGLDVEVRTLSRAPSGITLPDTDIRGVRYRRSPTRGVGPYRWVGGDLDDLVRRYDVVHVHDTGALAECVVPAAKRCGVPVGVSTHGGYFHTRRFAWLKEVWLRGPTRRVFRQADAVWFTSHADRIRHRATGVCGEVLGNAVDTRPYALLARSPVAGRWVVVGRLAAHKGGMALLRALARHREVDSRPFECRFVGAEAERGVVASLAAEAMRLGIAARVTFVGRVDAVSLAREYSRAELALFPSTFEGFGVAVVEAQAAGVPVVAHRIAAHEERIIDGRTGALVDFGDAAATARRLGDLRGRETEPWKNAAREAASQMARRVVVPRWIDAYTRLVS